MKEKKLFAALARRFHSLFLILFSLTELASPAVRCPSGVAAK